MGLGCETTMPGKSPLQAKASSLDVLIVKPAVSGNVMKLLTVPPILPRTSLLTDFPSIVKMQLRTCKFASLEAKWALALAMYFPAGRESR
jgi:hypothetical protein